MAADAQFTKLNYTSYTDDKCATVKSATKEYKLGDCKKGTTYTCSGSPAQANETSYNDDTCTSYNSSKIFASGTCTATGPKTARTSKLLVCF